MIKKSLLMALMTVLVGATAWAQGSMLPESEMYVSGLKVGALESQMLNTFGQPTAIDRDQTSIYPKLRKFLRDLKTNYYNGLGFITGFVPGFDMHGNEVYSAVLTDRSAVTHRGLAVGDSDERMFELYGNDAQFIKHHGYTYVHGKKTKVDGEYRYRVNDGRGENSNAQMQVLIYKHTIVAISIGY